MKRLITDPITNSAQFFPKKGTLEFLQLAFREGFTAILQSLIGDTYDPGIVYIMRGVSNSGVYPAYNISEGVVFYNGEFFLVDATAFVSPGAEVAVCKIVQTQYTIFADPVTLSDATLHNIHNIRKIQVLSGAAGSEIANYSAAVRINLVIPPQLNLSATGLSSIGGVYPNLVVQTPAPTPSHEIVWHGNVTSNGAVITRLFGGATVSVVGHPSVGRYPVTHNIGNDNYFVLACVIGTNPAKFCGFDNKTGTNIDLIFADDDTYNDADFQMTIWKYVP